LSNTKSLYSTVLYGKGFTNDSNFIERALSNLREFMEDDGLAFLYQRFIALASVSVRFAKALDRSISWSMNDLINHAKAWLTESELSPFDVGFKLNEVLLSALAENESSSYGKPQEAFRTLACEHES
jgi:hypothetical protein